MNRPKIEKVISFIVIFLVLRITAPGFMKNISPENISSRSSSLVLNSGSSDIHELNGDDNSSKVCLSCHDGIIAQDTHMTPGLNNRGNTSIGLSHPVMINYADSYISKPYKYNSVHLLDPRIRLFGDKVECLSCHDPNSSNDHHLVMSNNRSMLCLSCHNM